MDFDPIITPRNLTFDNVFEFGFELEMEKNTSGANKLRSNNIKKKIAIVPFNIILNILRNKNKKTKNMASKFSLVVAS
ncbi:hypothetical protein J1N35_000050 [Gossypium stocksii]|uniref:Uncharacterized protein n=1 Tax=Gossypium stocksii TaxID=47602 RepID=A0A9D4AJS0_9ROSI|nr:hypothetical protein J1N35_000050 [Gossypium stocksii]